MYDHEQGAEQHELFENHLAFLGTHRGRVSREEDSVTVRSDRPEFSYAVLGKSASARQLAETFRVVQIAPWSGRWGRDLDALGYQPRLGLAYMTCAATTVDWSVHPGLEIRAVSDEEALDQFSETQARGFAEKEEVYREWHPWLQRANRRNLRNRDQIFYLGSLEGRPVGVTLLVFTPGVAGIYAVTTLPAWRRKGVSSALLRHALQEARRRDCRIITLQAILGSYAEKFYERLGFKSAFRLHALAR